LDGKKESRDLRGASSYGRYTGHRRAYPKPSLKGEREGDEKILWKLRSGWTRLVHHFKRHRDEKEFRGEKSADLDITAWRKKQSAGGKQELSKITEGEAGRGVGL